MLAKTPNDNATPEIPQPHLAPLPTPASAPLLLDLSEDLNDKHRDLAFEGFGAFRLSAKPSAMTGDATAFGQKRTVDTLMANG
ncbi:hypothetical protein [Pseudomonas synxantha]|uniref:Uncharacterized protein n=1 Tax=Pseudomonas synxantha TaxID=47883 RepID=A0AAU8TGJ2_9PSED|nr:hypothetical protein [Pseudomonas synxantha]AKA81853.1 hypothetical protein VO64_1307 [Pseudomonas synxantha]